MAVLLLGDLEDDHAPKGAIDGALERTLPLADNTADRVGRHLGLGDSARATELVQKYGPGALGELERVYDALKAHPDCNGKIGAVGFCFGGRMALALGLSRPLAAINSFYGGGMQQLFDRMPQMRSPVLALFGDQDVSIPAGTIAQLDELLDQAGKADLLSTE